MSDMPWAPTPGSSLHLACNGDDCVDFHLLNNVVLPTRNIAGLNPFNLAAYGLSARYPTLKTLRYHKASKDSLPVGWPAFRGGIHTRLITQPCPAALKILTETPLDIEKDKNSYLRIGNIKQTDSLLKLPDQEESQCV